MEFHHTIEVIDPTYDTGFKLLFGRENLSEEVLMEFLNALLADDPYFRDIVSLRYLNSEHPHERQDGRGVRYDILCETSAGHRFIVEMQKNRQAHFLERSIYYVSRAVAEQGFRGKDEDDNYWDYSLIPVIGVFLCNFATPELPDKFVTYARLADRDTGKPIGDSIRCIYIQLPLFSKTAEADCNTYLEEWIYNIKYMGPNQNVAFTSHREVFRRLAQISSVASLNEAERRSYEADLKAARDYHAEMNTARADARAEGRAEGRTEEKYTIAKVLLGMGQSPEFVAQATGLSIEDILTM